VLSFTSLAEAQCLKDTDCKGDRVCDAGACKAPARVADQDPNGWDVGATAPPADTAASVPPADTAASAGAPPATAPVAGVPAAAHAVKSGVPLQMREPSAEVADERPRPKMKRRSTGMMVAGIVMVSVSPLPLIGGLMMATERSRCNAYSDGVLDYHRECDTDGGVAAALTLTGLALIGAGIPLIVIGGKRVPAKEPWQAQLSPYAEPDGAGFRLRLQL
jgi:hypothetical protein